VISDKAVVLHVDSVSRCPTIGAIDLGHSLGDCNRVPEGLIESHKRKRGRICELQVHQLHQQRGQYDPPFPFLIEAKYHASGIWEINSWTAPIAATWQIEADAFIRPCCGETIREDAPCRHAHAATQPFIYTCGRAHEHAMIP
jgi:hypothetical protein